MKLGNYYLESRTYEGYPMMIAPISFWDAIPEVIDAHTGGCGPGKVGDLFVPDNLLGESIFLSCRIHDWMYYVGQTLEDKKIADMIFQWNITAQIDDGEFLDGPRLELGLKYYKAVRMFGGGSFPLAPEDLESSPVPRDTSFRC